MIAHLRCLRTLPALRDFAGLVQRASIAARSNTRRNSSTTEQLHTRPPRRSQSARVCVYKSVTQQLLSAAKRRAQAQLLQINEQNGLAPSPTAHRRRNDRAVRVAGPVRGAAQDGLRSSKAPARQDARARS